MSAIRKNRPVLFTVLAAFFVMIFPSMGKSDGGAAITGKVHYTGAPVTPVPIQFGAERQCAELHKSDGRAVNEEVVVNAGNTLKWALVYIREDVPGDFQPPPGQPLSARDRDLESATFDPRAERAQGALRMIARGRRFDDARRAVRLEPGQQHAALDLCARHFRCVADGPE